MRVSIGDPVTFVDSERREHAAIVIAVHGPEEWEAEGEAPSVNLVHADPNPEATDSYGRQLQKPTSVVHEANQGAGGMFWR